MNTLTQGAIASVSESGQHAKLAGPVTRGTNMKTRKSCEGNGDEIIENDIFIRQCFSRRSRRTCFQTFIGPGPVRVFFNVVSFATDFRDVT